MDMSEQDCAQYLANIIGVARADQKIVGKEQSIIDEVRVRIGAKKSVLNAGQKLIDSGNYQIAPIGGFASQVMNLADMLYVAAIDGDFDHREEAIIRDFRQQIGITDDQLARLIRDAINKVQLSTGTASCPNCNAAISVDARFCASCGAAIAAMDKSAAQTDMQIRSDGYVIEFCESTAGGFPAALEFAKTSPAFQSCVRVRKTWYQAAWPNSQFAEVLKLANYLGGMRNRRCFQDGQERPWDEMFGCAWCVRSRETAYRPIEYCFGKDENRLNNWGCRQARMDWAEWAPWMSYGSFKKSLMGLGPYEWTFDKKRIRHELETALFRFRNCPYLNFEFIEATLEFLPDTVRVESSDDWTYSRTYDQKPGSILVREETHSGGLMWSSEYYADGVRPKGFRVFVDILTKAAEKTRRADVAPQALIT